MSALLLTDDLKSIALTELCETPDLRRQSIDTLKKQILELPKENQINDVSDANLITYLRCRKYKLDAALHQTECVAKFSKEHPKWINNKSQDFVKFFDVVQVLEDADPEGRVIVIFRPTRIKHLFDDINFSEDFTRFQIWIFERLSKLLKVQICGLITIISFHGFTIWDNIKLSQRMNINHRVSLAKYIQTCAGFRLKGAFMFEQPSFFNWMWSIISVFLSDKLKKRIYLCGSDYKKIKILIRDNSVLPSCLGGKQSNDIGEDWVRQQSQLEQNGM